MASMAILPERDATSERAANFRKRIYDVFRKQAGIRKTDPLPSKIVHAVKWTVPTLGASQWGLLLNRNFDMED